MSEIGGTPTEREYRFESTASPDVTNFEWHFGDGDSSRLRVDQHVYTGTPGTTETYTVTLTGRAGSNQLQAQKDLKIEFK